MSACRWQCGFVREVKGGGKEPGIVCLHSILARLRQNDFISHLEKYILINRQVGFTESWANISSLIGTHTPSSWLPWFYLWLRMDVFWVPFSPGSVSNSITRPRVLQFTNIQMFYYSFFLKHIHVLRNSVWSMMIARMCAWAHTQFPHPLSTSPLPFVPVAWSFMLGNLAFRAGM